MLIIIRDLLKYDKRFLFGFVTMLLLIFLAILSLFSPYNPRSWNVVPRDLPPSFKYLLGTNSMGQDIFWTATYAIRNSLILGVVAALISRTIAIFLGLTAGYKGGTTDMILMTVNDSFLIIPLFPLLILFAFILRTRMNIIILATILGIFGWAWDARLFRSQILSLREREFTYTAILSGMKVFKVILKEHLPFTIPLILAATLNNMLWAIGMELTLAVLGLSSLEIPTLGTMIHWAVQYQAMLRDMWQWILTPAVACIFLFLALYMLSISISEFLDPRIRLQRIKMMRG